MVILLIFILLYFILISFFIFGWSKIEIFSIEKKAYIPVSVLIAVRNEEENILNILNDIKNQDYNNNYFEVIVINDNSTDKTYELVNEFVKENKNFRIINLDENKKGKKAAIEEGVKQSKYQLIMTTDADCRINKKWLSTIASFYEKERPKIIISPVVFRQSKRILSFTNLQGIEFLSLISSTAGACGINRPIMCNGANLAYEKSVFEEFNNLMYNEIPSGDDIFLLLNVKKKYPKKIKFLKSNDATVYTKSQNSLNDFINQRIRWTSKSKNYTDFDILFTSLTVFFANFSILISLIISTFNYQYLYFSLIIFTLKSIPDYILLNTSARFFGIKNLNLLFFPLQFLYIWYVVFIAISSNFSKFLWKNREFK